MKNMLIALLLAGAVPAGCAAQEYSVTMTAVKDGKAYAHSQKNVPGEANNFVGKVRPAGAGAREIIFNTTLRKRDDGALVLDCMFELDGPQKRTPVYESAGSVSLERGRKVLVSSGGGVKYYLELSGTDPWETARNYLVSTELSCGRERLPSKLALLPGTQGSFVLQLGGAGDRKYFMQLAAGEPAADGSFDFQYHTEIRAGGGKRGVLDGSVKLRPGEKARVVKKEKGCSFSVRAEKF